MSIEITNSTKKQLGAFYTPRHATNVLCQWAIRSKTDTVLEPSFGGCDFLISSRSRFQELGAQPFEIEKLLYGCDIDADAFGHLAKVLQNPNGNFIQRDFLQLNLSAFLNNQSGFDVVIGNPPYVSHHKMTATQKNNAMKALAENHIVIGKRASLWAYFVLHSMRFLRLGGRMAWVLPSSFLFADYSEHVRTYLRTHFERCLQIRLAERLFLSEGTEEISVITLCEGYSEIVQAGSIHTEIAANVQEAQSVIESWTTASSKWQQISAVPDVAPQISATHYEMLSQHPRVTLLGELFDIQIGIVSGANNFFILTKDQWDEHRLPKSCRTWILAKFRFIPGLSLTLADTNKIEELGEPCLLVDTKKTKVIGKHLNSYLKSFPEEKKKKNTTFKRRKRSGVWHQFNDSRIPIAFFPYMHDRGPLIAINHAGINSTNSIHRLYARRQLNQHELKLIAISILSTFSQLSAEFEGRTYGAGVLKHEPSEASKIKLLLPECSSSDVDEAFTKVDGLLRLGDHEGACRVADAFIFHNTDISDHESASRMLSEELTSVRNRRYPKTKQITGK